MSEYKEVKTLEEALQDLVNIVAMNQGGKDVHLEVTLPRTTIMVLTHRWRTKERDGKTSYGLIEKMNFMGGSVALIPQD